MENKKYAERLKENIQIAMVKARVNTKKDLAKRMGIPPTSLYTKFHKPSCFTAYDVYKIAKVLNVPISELTN